ncbi:zeta-crystallin [Phaeosphaeriaceae sp. PMI808]|nr:zeta-crystallin [Phaeosphaeriaceae sp. PMI808]
MRAIQINHFVKNFDEIEAKDIPNATPKSNSDHSIKITHAAVTHVDLLYAQGLHQNNRRHVKPPFILGNEFAGIITSSPSSSSLTPGTRVFGGGLGSYAETICVPEEAVHQVPRQWSLAEACAVGASGAVSYGALVSVAQIKSGETLLVLGASGGLGVMVIQIAKALGARVIAVVGSQEKAEVVRNIGAQGVANYNEENWVAKVKELTNGEGVDVVYDSIGAVESGVECLKYRGRLVIVGFAARDGNVEKIRANRILLKSAMVHGYRFGEDGRQDPQRTKDAWDGFMRLVEEEKIKPIIYKEVYDGLDSVRRALEDAKAHKVWGRAVLRIDELEREESQKARL